MTRWLVSVTMTSLTDALKEQIKQVAQDAPMPGVILPPTNKDLTIHVDGDYLAYFCSGNDDTEPGIARMNVLRKLEAGRAIVGASKIVVHLTMSGSHKGYRYHVATVKPYQAQRSGSRRPKNWEFLRAFLETYQGDVFTVKLWKDREADDGIAFVAHNSVLLYKQPLAAIYTADKDMRMLPGLHVDWNTYQVVEVPKGVYDIKRSPDGLQYGLKWFWLQMLQGDAADHIPGLPLYMGKKVGEVTAGKALAAADSHIEAFNVVSRMYAENYGEEWQDRFVEQAALLWLRTDHGASVRDFANYLPGLGHPGVSRVLAAFNRLESRVLEAHAEIESIRSAALQVADAGEPGQ